MNNNLQNVVEEIAKNLEAEKNRRADKREKLAQRKQSLEERIYLLERDTELDEDRVEEELKKLKLEIEVVNSRYDALDEVKLQLSDKDMKKLIKAVRAHRNQRIEESSRLVNEQKRINDEVERLKSRYADIEKQIAQLGKFTNGVLGHISGGIEQYHEVKYIHGLKKYIPEEYLPKSSQLGEAKAMDNDFPYVEELINSELV